MPNLALLMMLVAAPLVGVERVAPAAPSATCPVTLAVTRPFAEPSPSSASRFWYGSEALAVLLKTGGAWRGMGSKRRYRDKLFWWRDGYDGRTEPLPELTVIGRRLDGDAPPAEMSRATNAHHPAFGGWTMLVCVEFPTSGCWEVTGEYRGARLSFVVQVGP
jgi:hypothetical protein